MLFAHLSIPSILTAALLLGAAPDTAGADDTKTFDAAMQPILAAYLQISSTLAADKTDGVVAAAKKISKLSAKPDPKTVKGKHAKHYASMPRKLAEASKKLAAAKEIAAMREALKDLSKPMAMWVTLSKPKDVNVIYCSMAKGSWLQKPGEIANPYYGASMLRCGEVVAGPGMGKKGGHMKHGEHGEHGGHGGHGH